ncbi:PspC domain-containing protein [Bifidobacterium sp.]|uniref:PspC domain-containing protein n=1 Tax=Bifidobacterium sp. TaxID=41200 RepID=UPI0039EC5A3A
MNNTQMNGPTPPSAESRFFAWIRESGIERSDDRWIAGVGSGLAVRIGWDVVLVRVLFIVSTLCFGIGAAVYGLMWFLLPDRRSNAILLEELIAGRWDWSCVGVFLCILVAMIFPGAGLFILTLSFLGVFLMMLWSRNRRYQAEQGQPGHMPPPAEGQQKAARPSQSPFQSQDDSQPLGSSQRDVPEQGDAAANPSHRATQPSFTRPDFADSANTHYAPHSTAQAGMHAPQPYQYRPRTIHPRRRPAGPIVVSMLVGLMLLVGAGLFLYAGLSGLSTEQTLNMATIWSCANVIVLGAALVILGGSGRRSGGLIPFAILGLLLSFILVATSVGFGYASTSSHERTSGFERIPVHSHVSFGSTPSEMQRYSRGMILDASNATRGAGDDSRTATIDLSEYERDNGKHTITRDDGSKVESSCPTGKISFSFVETKATIIMPKHCAYSVNNYGVTNTSRANMGGTFLFLGDSKGVISLQHWFTMADNAPDATLPKDLANETLLIEVPSMLDGELSVIYAQ